MSEYAVPIVLADGKPRSLRYDWNALEALVDREIVFDDIDKHMQKPLSHLREVRVILWAGLIHEDAALTPEAVGALMMPLRDMGDWAERIGRAMLLSFGSGKSGDLKNAATPGATPAASASQAATTSATPDEPPTA